MAETMRSRFLKNSFDWGTLDEESRYEVWSLHLEAGGQDVSYPRFCDLMDEVYNVN